VKDFRCSHCGVRSEIGIHDCLQNGPSLEQRIKRLEDVLEILVAPNNHGNHPLYDLWQKVKTKMDEK